MKLVVLASSVSCLKTKEHVWDHIWFISVVCLTSSFGKQIQEKEPEKNNTFELQDLWSRDCGNVCY
jgi:hypothetical protein